MANNRFSSPGRHSLPRKKASIDCRESLRSGSFSPTAHIQRGTSAITRNGLSPLQHHHPHQHGMDTRNSQQDDPHHFEYFVPRSISEFNLATTSVQDIAIPISPPVSVLKPCSIVTTSIPSQIKSNSNAVGVNTCQMGRLNVESTTSNITGGINALAPKNREKMVTFEDENCSSSTPIRKNFASTMENVFM